MATKKKFNWKLGLIGFFALAGLFLALTIGIKKSKDFKVQHFQEVKSEVGVDGRAAVGSPEIYQVRMSAALAWELSSKYTGVWRTIALILIIAFGAFVALYGSGVISFGIGTNAPNYVAFLIWALAAACYFGAYSSAHNSNYRDLTKDQYEAVKGDPVKLRALFTDKPIIR